MTMSVSRRAFLMTMAATALSGKALADFNPLYDDDARTPGLRDESLFPPPESPVDFPIEQIDLEDIPERFHRQDVNWEGLDAAGTIVVDPSQRFLFLVGENNTAMRYGVGVGKAGFAWHGDATVGMKRRWPRWLPPEEMVYRDAKAKEWVNGMPGGPENPLGARALYLNANGVDTLYRIHGTNDPKSIGKAMSSGCIRMLNEDVADLFDRVPVGTKVIVLQASI